MKPILNGSTTCFIGPAKSSHVIIDASAYYAAFYHAACRARHFIALAGWQFDSGVRLLRGARAANAPYPVELLPFLNALCRERPELRVYILAWDYSLVYSLEREWLQGLKFAFQGEPAIRFEFDAHPNLGGSHHQKLAVIDGELAFVGGLDICDERWDERAHRSSDACRVNQAGQACRPNHEVQAAVQGAAARAVTALFVERWRRALGEQLQLSSLADDSAAQLDLTAIDDTAILPLAAHEVALSRTLPGETGANVTEVKAAVSAALLAAERLIYIETQYFTSRSVTAVLLERFRDTRKPPLQVLVLMPRGADNSKEKFALGDLQAAVLSELEAAAEQCGHQLRFLCSAVAGADCEAATFIHSKVLIVDDELLCVGSANMTERSMALDSELCLLWQGPPGSALSRDIAKVRASLLAEHSGEPEAELVEIEGLVARVDDAIESRASRLRACHFDPVSVNQLKRAIFDPEGPMQFG
jgi:phospholipase D1/2